MIGLHSSEKKQIKYLVSTEIFQNRNIQNMQYVQIYIKYPINTTEPNKT